MKERIAGLLRDLIKAALIGAGIASALGAVLFLGGLLFGGPAAGLEAAKDGLLLAFSALLFLVAGMLLLRGKKPEQIRLEGRFRSHFTVIGPKTMLLAVSAGVLLIVIAADALQRSFG